MGAIISACNKKNTVRNTGKECDVAMVATAMLIAVSNTVKFTDLDLQDPVEWLNNLIHLKLAFPIFGQNAPIRGIQNNTEADSIVTLDDGLQVFLRYGLYNRVFETTSGGLCYAKSLQSLLNSGMWILEIDQQGQFLARVNNDKTYSGLITDFMYSPSPVLADFKGTPYKNRFSYSISPVELVNNGKVFAGASALLSMMGLIDAKVTQITDPVIATPAVSATRTYTITNVGADGDTFELVEFGVTLTGEVVKTSTETTVTQVAAKIVAAINNLTSTTGFSASNAAGVITITAPSWLGAVTTNTVATISGTIAGTHTAFAGGTTVVSTAYLGVQTECAETDLLSRFGSKFAFLNNFEITEKTTGEIVTATGVTYNAGSKRLEFTGPFNDGFTYIFKGGEPINWLNHGIEGFDASEIELGAEVTF